jgi:hypothetical protein
MNMIFLITLILLQSFIFSGISGAPQKIYTTKEKFENNFNKKCSKYPFIKQYLANLEAPSNRYIVFFMYKEGVSNGGLGDRMSGLVSAMSFALRTNRTLLISGDAAFTEAFQPYHPNNDDGKRSWINWGWAGWKETYAFAGRKGNWYNCVNTHRGMCKLDKDLSERVVNYVSNRAYLCRWVVKSNIFRKSNLDLLGITNKTDLFEAAGCMLRLAMWPTKTLWSDFDRILEPKKALLSGVNSYQVI